MLRLHKLDGLFWLQLREFGPSWVVPKRPAPKAVPEIS